MMMMMIPRQMRRLVPSWFFEKENFFSSTYPSMVQVRVRCGDDGRRGAAAAAELIRSLRVERQPTMQYSQRVEVSEGNDDGLALHPGTMSVMRHSRQRDESVTDEAAVRDETALRYN